MDSFSPSLAGVVLLELHRLPSFACGILLACVLGRGAKGLDLVLLENRCVCKPLVTVFCNRNGRVRKGDCEID